MLLFKLGNFVFYGGCEIVDIFRVRERYGLFSIVLRRHLTRCSTSFVGFRLSALTNIGGIQQGQSQNVLNAQQQANQMQAMEPYQRLGVYGQGVGQISQTPGSIQQQVTPDPTALQTALGTTSVLGGLMGLGSGYANQRAQQTAGF